MARNSKTLIVTFQDGSELEVTPTLEDKLAFESALRKNKNWGEIKDSAIKMHPFLAWNALRRKGQTELTWEQFTTGETAAVDVELKQDEEPDQDAELEVPPVGKGTRTGRSTSSSSPSPSAPASPSESGETKPE